MRNLQEIVFFTILKKLHCLSIMYSFPLQILHECMCYSDGNDVGTAYIGEHARSGEPRVDHLNSGGLARRGSDVTDECDRGYREGDSIDVEHQEW